MFLRQELLVRSRNTHSLCFFTNVSPPLPPPFVRVTSFNFFKLLLEEFFVLTTKLVEYEISGHTYMFVIVDCFY